MASSRKKSKRIDTLLEQIDGDLVAILQEIVNTTPPEEVTPFVDNLYLEHGLFTLPRIRKLK